MFLVRNIRKPRRCVDGKTGGFTVIELTVVVVILLIMTVLSYPMVQSTFRNFRLQGATASFTGAIQNTRYRAIANGYPFRLVVSKAASTFQVQSDPTFTNVWGDVDGAEPISGSGNTAAIDQDVTLQFSPSGQVKATTGATTMTVAYGTSTKQIVVSTFGSIHVN